MRKDKLSNLVDIISGGTPKTSVKEYWDNGTIGWLSVADFNNDMRYVYTTDKKITQAGLENSNTKLLNKDDVVISARGTVGALAQIGTPLCFNQSCFGLRGKKGVIDNTFLYYCLKNYVLNIIKRSHGSVFNTINLDSFDLMEIEYPEHLSIQQRIAAVLSALDEKIELNNRINVELEFMVKRLYDYWFVQFDFPNKNGKPYRSSGGKMVWNVDLKRDIPEGWEVLRLADVISRSATGLNPRDNFNLGQGDNYYITIKNVKNGKIIFDTNCDRVDDDALRIINERSDLRPGDILFTSIEPVGVTYFIHESPKNWNINESVFTLRPNRSKVSSEYLFMLLSSLEMKAFTKNVSAGSIHKGIRHGVLKTFKVSYGRKELIEDFSSYIRPTLKRINLLDKENQRLSELRDWLLPMLMNGQVKVN